MKQPVETCPAARAFVYEPDFPEFFKVIATLAGSNFYGNSYAMTYFNVEEAPQPTLAPMPVPQAPVETHFAASTIAIIIAIVIVGFLILRKG